MFSRNVKENIVKLGGGPDLLKEPERGEKKQRQLPRSEKDNVKSLSS